MFFQRRENGVTQDISRVDINQRVSNKGKQIISIESGAKIYKFGEHLSLPEKIWVVQEICDFIREIDPYKTLK